jgi:isopentenyl phosphate kinase
MVEKIPDTRTHLVFLKLGGSLITEKDRTRTPRLETISRLAAEISSALDSNPTLRLILGHGAGSFGHVSAEKYGTREGVKSQKDWLGFAEVWWDASSLNRLVLEAFHTEGLPVIALPPSAGVSVTDGRITSWDLGPVKSALSGGLLPVIYGDVMFDSVRGGTILSTEELFAHLAVQLMPERILLAGIEPGVWWDYPACTQLVRVITKENIKEIIPVLRGSHATDVTGGMASKVLQSMSLAEEVPQLETWIFSGDQRDQVKYALLGRQSGTVILADNRRDKDTI